MKEYRNTSKKGFSLLELLLVMGIVAAMIVAAFIIYPKVMTQVRVNNEIKNISTIITGIKALYQGQSDLAGFSTPVLIKSKIAPDNMVQAGNNVMLRNSWEGYFSMGLAGVGVAGGGTVWNAVTINTAGIPSADCLRLVNELYRQYNVNLTYLLVNSTYLYASGVPYTIDNAATACGKSESGTVQLGILQ